MKVYIYCGLPGAGKSTLIKERHPGAVVCSADDFFIDSRTGAYEFNPSQLPVAHAECLRKFVGRITSTQFPDVVVDNTNTTVAEIAPYAALALAYGHELTVVTVECDPDVAAARNTHGIPAAAVHSMHMRLKKRELPPWWTQDVVPAFVDQTMTPLKHLKVGDMVTIGDDPEPRKIVELYDQAKFSGGFKVDRPVGAFLSWNEDEATLVDSHDP